MACSSSPSLGLDGAGAVGVVSRFQARAHNGNSPYGNPPPSCRASTEGRPESGGTENRPRPWNRDQAHDKSRIGHLKRTRRCQGAALTTHPHRTHQIRSEGPGCDTFLICKSVLHQLRKANTRQNTLTATETPEKLANHAAFRTISARVVTERVSTCNVAPNRPRKLHAEERGICEA